METKQVTTTVFQTHDEAIAALQVLKENHFPMKQVSLLGKGEYNDETDEIKEIKNYNNLPLYIGMGAGTVVGLLTGIGVFAIPGFGILYGAGAVVGTIAGFDLGLIGGGVISLLATAGIHTGSAAKYETHLHNGNFVLIIHGTPFEIETVQKLLVGHGMPLEIHPVNI